MDDFACTLILDHAREGAHVRTAFFEAHAELLQKAALSAARCLAQGGKLLLCGNGGSAADSQHLAAEFVNRFLIDRPALPAIALTTDSSVLTAVGNDASFDTVFSRQVEALGQEGDVLLGISTSGRSTNVILALQAARERKLTTIGLTGAGGGSMGELCDFLFTVPSEKTPVIQEVHLACEHLFCQLVDYYLFDNAAALAL